MKKESIIDAKRLLFTLCRIVEKVNRMIYEEVDEVLKFSLKEILKCMKGKVGIVRIIDEKGRYLLLRVSCGVSREYEKKPSIKVGESIAGVAFEKEKPIAVDDLRKNRRYRYPEYAEKEGILSLLCTPLISERRKIGTFSVYFSEPRSFFREEIGFFEIIGSFLAIILVTHDIKKKMHEQYINTIKGLINGLEAKDPYTKGHSERVWRIALEIAKQMEFPSREINILKEMGILHDIGKLVIDTHILHKKGPLTEEEWEVIKSHPLIGVRLLEPVEAFHPGLPIVRFHHERYDGRGYPNGLIGETIPRLARIISVADAFDAMISPRPYRDRLPLPQVKEELRRGAGKQFDGEVTEILLALLEEGRLRKILGRHF